MAKVRIRVSGEETEDLDNVIKQLKELSSTLGMKFIGPVRFPRKNLLVATRRTPCGDGTDSYERWEKRISKVLVDIEGDEKFIKQILRVKVPTNVFVKLSLS